MENKKRLAINMIAQLLSFAIGLLISFALTSYVTEHVGKEIYGYVGLANTFVSYTNIVTVALNTMLNRFVTIKLKQEDIKSANRYYSSVGISYLLGAVILTVPAALIVVFLDCMIKIPAESLLDIQVLWALIFAAFGVGLITNVFATSMFAKNRLDLQAKRALESNIIKAGVLLFMFLFFVPKVWYVGFATLMCAVYVGFSNYYYKEKLTPQLRIKREDFSWKTVLELVGVGIWSSVNQLTQTLLNGLDLLISNLFIDPMSMSLMSFSKTVPVQLLNLIGLVSNTFSPQMTLTYAEGDMKKFLKETKSAVKICGVLCSVPVLGFTVFGKAFFSLWLPSLSESEIQTVQILSIMTLLPNILSVYVYPLYTVNTITCKLKIPVLVSFFISIINLAGAFILLKTTNLGVFAIKLVSTVLLVLRVLLFVPIYAAHNLNEKWYAFYPPLLRGLLSSSLIVGLYVLMQNKIMPHSWKQLIVTAAGAGMIGYAVNILTVLDAAERKKFFQMIVKKFARHKNG